MPPITIPQVWLDEIADAMRSADDEVCAELFVRLIDRFGQPLAARAWAQVAIQMHGDLPLPEPEPGRALVVSVTEAGAAELVDLPADGSLDAFAQLLGLPASNVTADPDRLAGIEPFVNPGGIVAVVRDRAGREVCRYNLTVDDPHSGVDHTAALVATEGATLFMCDGDSGEVMFKSRRA